MHDTLSCSTYQEFLTSVVCHYDYESKIGRSKPSGILRTISVNLHTVAHQNACPHINHHTKPGRLKASTVEHQNTTKPSHYRRIFCPAARIAYNIHRMSRPSKQEFQLYRELCEADRDISGLQRETICAIGAIARQGYKTIKGLPSTKPYIPIGHRAHFVPDTDRRYFNPWHDTHTIQLPETLPSSGQERIVQVGTETTIRRHRYRSGLWISLPASKREVVVVTKPLQAPSKKSAWVPETVNRISTAGDAFRGNWYAEHARPIGKTIAHPRDKTYRRYHDAQPTYHASCHYSSPEELLQDRATRNIEALHIAGLVSGHLHAALDLDCSSTSLQPLAEAWAQIAT